MRSYLQKMFSLQGQCTVRCHIQHSRYVASQPISVDDQECNQGTKWKRWKPHETKVLIEAKKLELSRFRLVNAGKGSICKRTKWEEIEIFCLENGVERTAQQCKERWDRLMAAYTQIKTWEDVRGADKKSSFWSLNLDEKKSIGFLMNLDQEIYAELSQIISRKNVTNASADMSLKNDVQQKVDSASLSDCNTVANGSGLYSTDNNNGGNVEGASGFLPLANGGIDEQRLEDKDEEYTAIKLSSEASNITKSTDANSSEFYNKAVRIQNTNQMKWHQSHTVEGVKVYREDNSVTDSHSQDVHESRKLFGLSTENNSSLYRDDNDITQLLSDGLQGDSAQYETSDFSSRKSAHIFSVDHHDGQTPNHLSSENMSTKANCNSGRPFREFTKDENSLHADGINQKISQHYYCQNEPSFGKLPSFARSDQTREQISTGTLLGEDANTKDSSKRERMCNVDMNQPSTVDSLDQCQQYSQMSFIFSPTRLVDDKSKLPEDELSEKDASKTSCKLLQQDPEELNLTRGIQSQNNDVLSDEPSKDSFSLQQTSVRGNKIMNRVDISRLISDEVEADFERNPIKDYFQKQHESNDFLSDANRSEQSNLLVQEVNTISSSERLTAEHQLSCIQKIIPGERQNEVSDQENLSSALNNAHFDGKFDETIKNLNSCIDRTENNVVHRKNESESGKESVHVKLGSTIGDSHGSEITQELSGNFTISTSAAVEEKDSMRFDNDLDTCKGRSTECTSKKERTISNGSEDIFLYIRCGVSKLTMFVSETLRKFFKG